VGGDVSGDEVIAEVGIAEVALSPTIVDEAISVFRELKTLSSDVVELDSLLDSVVAAGSAIADAEVVSGERVRIVSSMEEERGAKELGTTKVLAGGTPLMGPGVVDTSSNVVEEPATVVPPFPDPAAMLETAFWSPTRVRTRPMTLVPAGTFPSKIAWANPSALSAKMVVELSNNLCSHIKFDLSLKYPAIESGVREEWGFGANVMNLTFTSVKYVPLAASLIV